MLLLTGATGTIGAPLLRRLTTARIPVRCLVRDPRRLRAERVRVQIALGDLADPPSFRNALRGVTTVVHLAGSSRDQPRGSIEELNAIATWRMVAAAERAGVEHFVLLSAVGASAHSRARLLRSKALAEEALQASGLRSTVLAPSLVYAAADPWDTLLGRLALLPAVPLAGRGRARFTPIWADDVAACAMAVLDPAGDAARAARYELGGPDEVSAEQLVRALVAAHGRPRRLLKVPIPLASRALRVGEALMKSAAPLTWDEAELLEVAMVAAGGTADAEALGVVPKRLAAVLGVSA